MTPEKQFSNLAETARLVVQEIDCAVRLTKTSSLPAPQDRMVAGSYAAGISQLGLVLKTMLVVALDLEAEAAGVRY